MGPTQANPSWMGCRDQELPDPSIYGWSSPIGVSRPPLMFLGRFGTHVFSIENYPHQKETLFFFFFFENQKETLFLNVH